MLERVTSYLGSDREDNVYKLTVSDDGHDICVETRDEIESRGGVSMTELTRILLEESEEHEEGTPERMEHWTPHERCKSAVVRHFDE